MNCNSRYYKKLLFFTFILLISNVSNYGQKASETKSVKGSWDLIITVPPQRPADNRITFSGKETSGTFVDKFNHEGIWKLEGNKITWEYRNVPNLKNTFVGTLNEDWSAIKGENFGTWQGKKFKGTWTGKPVKNKDSGKSETQKWREDLQFIAKELPKKHKNLFHRLSREKFFNAVKQLDSKLHTLTKNQIALEFARIVALARDGHTGFYPIFAPELNFRAFPLRLYMYEDGVFVQIASREYKNLVGGKVLKIGDVSIDDVFKKVSQYIPKDNVMGAKRLAPIYMVSPEVLNAFGFSGNADKAEFTIQKENRVSTHMIKLLPNENSSTRLSRTSMQNWFDARDNAKNPTPLWLKNPNKNYWFEFLKKEKLFYVQMNAVVNDNSKPLKDFFDEIVTFVKANDVEKFVLDLRRNGGGTNRLVPPIIRGLVQMEKIDRKGHLFVITGRQTFSAAQNLVNNIETYTNAIFVGEPTASHVNMYGDARRFTFPNSGMAIRISELWHQDKNERDTRIWTAPHIAADLKFTEYANNIDPAIKEIIEYKPQKTLGEIIRNAIQKGDVDSATGELVRYKNNPRNKYRTALRTINIWGYTELARRNIDLAIELFKLNVKLHPKTANVYDSLAYAYLIRGDKAKAIENYERTLKIDPNLQSAKEALKKLRR